MTYNSKIVSIEHSGSYLYSRALKNIRENKLIDALELLRSAIEKEPENRKYRLELSELYCRIGLHELSKRLLFDLLESENEDNAECYFCLAMNRLAEKDRTGARRAIDIYRKKTDKNEFSARVESIDEELIDGFLDDAYDEDRKKERAKRNTERAYAAIKADEPEKAARIFERLNRQGRLTREDAVYYAYALRQSGREDDAEALLSSFDESQIDDIQSLCILSSLLGNEANRGRATAVLDRLIRMDMTDNEQMMIIAMLIQADRFDDAEKLATDMLHIHPYDKEVLHVNALIQLRKGTGDIQAASYWKKILRIDPEDSIAGYYVKCAEEGKLDSQEIPINYEVSSREYLKRLMLVLKLLSVNDEAVLRIWRQDGDFRKCVIWATNLEHEECVKAAVMILVKADDDLSRSVLRELMDRHTFSYDIKTHILSLVRAQGGDPSRIIPQDVETGDGVMPDAETMFKSLPAFTRQLIRYAAEVVEEDYDTEALDALTMRWCVQQELTHDRPCVLLSSQEASAALTWNYLLEKNIHVQPGKLARSFECKPRRMLYYASHMASVFGRIYEDNGNENH